MYTTDTHFKLHDEHIIPGSVEIKYILIRLSPAENTWHWLFVDTFKTTSVNHKQPYMAAVRVWVRVKV